MDIDQVKKYEFGSIGDKKENCFEQPYSALKLFEVTYAVSSEFDSFL